MNEDVIELPRGGKIVRIGKSEFYAVSTWGRADVRIFEQAGFHCATQKEVEKFAQDFPWLFVLFNCGMSCTEENAGDPNGMAYVILKRLPS